MYPPTKPSEAQSPRLPTVSAVASEVCDSFWMAAVGAAPATQRSASPSSGPSNVGAINSATMLVTAAAVLRTMVPMPSPSTPTTEKQAATPNIAGIGSPVGVSLPLRQYAADPVGDQTSNQGDNEHHPRHQHRLGHQHRAPLGVAPVSVTRMVPVPYSEHIIIAPKAPAAIKPRSVPGEAAAQHGVIGLHAPRRSDEDPQADDKERQHHRRPGRRPCGPTVSPTRP